MAQCHGRTKKGTRCRNKSAEGSAYCPLHEDQAQEAGGRGGNGGSRDDTADLLRTAFGVALLGAVVLWAITKGR